MARGGGRLRSDQVIDPAVGFSEIVELGASVKSGEPLLRVHARSDSAAALAIDMALKAISIDEQARSEPPLVWQRIGATEAA